MCGVEGAEYGFTADIRVARDDYYRCAVSLPDAPRVWAPARGPGRVRGCDICGRGPSQRVPAGRRGRGGEPLDLAI